MNLLVSYKLPPYHSQHQLESNKPLQRKSKTTASPHLKAEESERYQIMTEIKPAALVQARRITLSNSEMLLRAIIVVHTHTCTHTTHTYTHTHHTHMHTHTTHTYIHTHTHTYTHHTHTHTYTHHTHIHTHTHMHTHHTHTYTLTHTAHTHTLTHKCTHKCTHTHTHTHKHAHTHTHTHNHIHKHSYAYMHTRYTCKSLIIDNLELKHVKLYEATNIESANFAFR